jgi:serpin B
MKHLLTHSLCIITILILAGCGEGDDEHMEEDPGSAVNANMNSEDYEKAASANNELGFRLIKEVEADENGNKFISPLSLSMALSMIYNGAEGTTKEEIASVLGSESAELDAWNEQNAALFSALNRDEEQVDLHMANSIWLQDQYHFQQEFAQITSDYYAAQQEEINFQSGEAAKKINDWVEAATNDKITDMVEEPLNPDLIAIIINALYFKGEWTHEFDKNNTEDRPFYLNNGSTEEVPLMSLKEELLYMEKEDFQAVALPYGDEETISMHVFLPNEDTDLEALRESLTDESWKALTTQFQEAKGTVLLPKFELEYEVILNDTLHQLGMEAAFNRNDADFSHMIKEEDSIWIDQVKQKTFIEVNEEGTEAAAATSIEMETTSLPAADPFYMEVNRPFFFTITDKETGSILFMGEISNL